MPEVALTELWLPVLVAAVFVFIASSVIHVALPWHSGDHKQLPGEASVLAAMRDAGVRRGMYHFPYCGSMKEMATEEHVAKQKLGPVGYLTVLETGPIKMGGALLQWFVYTLVVGVFVGYIASLALGAGADYARVFRVTGTIAILAYALPEVQGSIWKGMPWSVAFRFVIDGVIYGLVTAGTFGWLWPSG